MNASSEMKVAKGRLESFAGFLRGLHYNVSWQYNKGVITLHANRQHESHSLIFTNGGDPYFTHYTYIESKISNAPMCNLVSKHLGLNLQFDYTLNDAKPKPKSPTQLKLEIDYHLLELHEYIQEDNKVKINETKEILSLLSKEL